MKLIDLPSGKQAILRTRLTWGARCRIDRAGEPPAALAEVYAQAAQPGMTNAQVEAAVEPLLIPHVGALSAMSTKVSVARLLGWVESWDFGDVTEEILDTLDEDDVLLLIKECDALDAAAAAKRKDTPDGFGDPQSPTDAVRLSAPASTAPLQAVPAS